jgi:hypothetical protein
LSNQDLRLGRGLAADTAAVDDATWAGAARCAAAGGDRACGFAGALPGLVVPCMGATWGGGYEPRRMGMSGAGGGGSGNLSRFMDRIAYDGGGRGRRFGSFN